MISCGGEWWVVVVESGSFAWDAKKIGLKFKWRGSLVHKVTRFGYYLLLYINIYLRCDYFTICERALSLNIYVWCYYINSIADMMLNLELSWPTCYRLGDEEFFEFGVAWLQVSPCTQGRRFNTFMWPRPCWIYFCEPSTGETASTERLILNSTPIFIDIDG